MNETADPIFAALLSYLDKHPEGSGWYRIEMACGIPRDQFPPGTNMMTYLQAMVAAGLIRTEKLNGKERFFSAPRENAAKLEWR